MYPESPMSLVTVLHIIGQTEHTKACCSFITGFFGNFITYYNTFLNHMYEVEIST